MSEATPSEPPPEAGLPRFTGIFYERVGGALVPLAATVLAFLIGGLVVLITGHNPVTAYRAIFNGTGFNWLFPWVTGDERRIAAKDLQQTLRVTTPLILTALAVAFAFRAGLFNIGGQGQYWVGLHRRRSSSGRTSQACRARCTSCSGWPPGSSAAWSGEASPASCARRRAPTR